MKNRMLVTLVLSVALALPGFTQQTNSNTNAPASSDQAYPPSQNAGTAEREPLKPLTSRDFWDGDDPNVVNLITHPFARKKYVQRTVGPIRDRLNELDQLTAENAKAIKDVDARAQHGIQLASEKANLADEHTTDATNRAQTAQAAATQASTRVSTAQQTVGNLDQYKGGTQTEIRFRPGQSVLSKQSKDALDQMATPLKDQHNYIIEIHGFAAGSGQAAIANSRMMADSVVRYLVQTDQIPVYRIYAVGMGNAPVAGEGTTTRHVSGGRVEIDVLKNDLVSSTQH